MIFKRTWIKVTFPNSEEVTLINCDYDKLINIEIDWDKRTIKRI